ncbi:MAG TPA: prenyltransferase/squalene oxidase repeat-containing protein [Conexibacter sp.]|nr:prenyltransferase/squalene oxidase repeat-containing protein [Conexibacter sp.]
MRQQNQLLIRALLVAASVLATASPSGLAASADVHVRIEGVTQTLFDRVVRTDGHDVRALSDNAAHRCDGTNGGANPSPGPTATAATVDALATLGQPFDGHWFAGYDDYFMQQLGPERENADELWWWGLLVDGRFSPAGGCQARVGDGDEVLWAGDAFDNRPLLRLAGAVATPTALVDTPLTVTVTATDGGTRSAVGDPYAGAQVAAVDVAGQPAAAGVADVGTSAADGSATVIFHATGWQRLKARGPVSGGPGAPPAAIASNSVDVCVEATPGAGCAGMPPSQVAVIPPAIPGDPPPAGGGSPPPPPPTVQPPSAPPTPRAESRTVWKRRLTAGSSVRVRFAPGRPAFVVRPATSRATIELRAGGRRRRVVLPPGRGVAHVVRGPRLRRPGWVKLRVVSGTVRVTLAPPATVAATASAASTEPASAAAPASGDQARLDLTIRFLQDAQNADGGFGGSRGAPSDPLFSAWVAIALAAGGINPQDQAKPGGADVYTYVAQHAGALEWTTDFERAALVADAAGASPRDFGGVDLVGAILGRQLPSGAFSYEAGGKIGYVNATAFAILALVPLHEPAVDAALQRCTDWLLTVQDRDGSWGYAPGAEPSSDTTAAVIQALHAAGRTDTPQETAAWTYLAGLHNADGGFGFSDTLPQSNTASTAWIAQAMWAAGIDPSNAFDNSPSPLDYLASMQRADGSIAWKAGDDRNSVWMTAYAAPAYAGRPLPLAAVPRAVRTPAPAAAQPVEAPAGALDKATIAGRGGVGTASGGVVIAGGGGNGAPLFGRPQPQSRGRTPGGLHETNPHGAEPRHAVPAHRPHRASDQAHGDPRVTGTVLGRQPAAAPGLRSAEAGGRTPGPQLPLALVGALLLCGGLGAHIERRRPTPERRVLA